MRIPIHINFSKFNAEGMNSALAPFIGIEPHAGIFCLQNVMMELLEFTGINGGIDANQLIATIHFLLHNFSGGLYIWAALPGHGRETLRRSAWF